MATGVFQQLRDRFKQLDPSALSELKSTLSNWLEQNYNQLPEVQRQDSNGIMMQYFHWYIPPDGKLWGEVADNAQALANAGFTALWLPPIYKANGGGYDVGYGTYDLFDLGEFDQKGSVRTKYGTKDELVAAGKAIQAAGIQLYLDVVFNHKMGADVEEEIEAIPVDSNNRNQDIGGVEKIKAWTQFTFPGRGDKYSSMKWHWWHFDSVNYNSYKPGDGTIYRFKDKRFASKVDLSQGNYDFLMGCDLDMGNDQVREELKYWGRWIIDTLGVNGFRLDAIKHIEGDFFSDWLDHLEDYAKRDLFTVGEYWTQDIGALHWYIGNSGGRLSLFDTPLHYKFYQASKAGGFFDMRTILDGTLMKEQPAFAVTFVDNHDTQPLQALESVVESWFKPLAYALILLRREGYPCVFYPDYFGAHYKDKGRDGNDYEIWMDSYKETIDKLLLARRDFAFGDQYDYFDHEDVIGWTRVGTGEHPLAMAVILSDGPGGSKWMEVRKPNTRFRDLMGHIPDPITTNENGWGEFHCNGGSVSVWVEESPLRIFLSKISASVLGNLFKD
ncbi:MAG: alpha-amylase [Oscillatoriales cyanobacterium RM2_1_1]|nr:alpha-amylase [Oscillatoriales cyanobacterium SM2_3_0]NJO47054.1 alpha-amylase [Oscillatoriales cyanobacterium RM2_1_1]